MSARAAAGAAAVLASAALLPPRTSPPVGGLGGNGSYAARATGIGRPAGLAVGTGGAVYIAAPEAHRVFKLDTSGRLTVVAGGGGAYGEGGPAVSASLSTPVGVALDATGALLVADDGDRVVRRIDAASGLIITVVGSPPPSPMPTAPRMREGGRAGDPTRPPVRPWALAADGAGHVYVADRAAHVVFLVRAAGREVQVVAGTGVPGYAGDGGPAVAARLSSPEGLAVDRAGNLFIADRGNACVRRVDARTGVITTIAGSGFAGDSGNGGPGARAELRDPVAVAVDGAGDVFVADLGASHVRRVDGRTGVISTLSGLDGTTPSALAVAADGALLVGDANGAAVLRHAAHGVTPLAGDGGLGSVGDGGPATAAHLSRPSGLARDAGGSLYVADVVANRVRRIDGRTGAISTVAGNGRAGTSGDGGLARRATLNAPEGVAVDRDGRLWIADTGNHRIRRVERDGTIVAVAGSGRLGRADDRPALECEISEPAAVAFDGQGRLLVWPRGSGLVQRIDPDGVLRTIVGSINTREGLRAGARANSGTLESIQGIGGGPRDVFFVTEDSLRVWRVDGETGVARPFAGRGAGPGDPSDELLSVNLGPIVALAADETGALYVAEWTGEIQRVARTRRLETVLKAADPRLQPAGLLPVGSDTVYISDRGGYVWRLGPEGGLTLVAGGGPGF